MAWVVISKSHDRIALSFLMVGLVAGLWIFSYGMILAAVVQSVGAIMGSLALLTFGGEVSEE
ncbi:MAG: hypothetical protein GOU98_01145 [Candidatus Altiarchaeota archaeon]|nr:hypothetical protein [Candidatus Altiarchaeota archaeon]